MNTVLSMSLSWKSACINLVVSCSSLAKIGWENTALVLSGAPGLISFSASSCSLLKFPFNLIIFHLKCVVIPWHSSLILYSYNEWNTFFPFSEHSISRFSSILYIFCFLQIALLLFVWCNLSFHVKGGLVLVWWFLGFQSYLRVEP